MLNFDFLRFAISPLAIFISVVIVNIGKFESDPFIATVHGIFQLILFYGLLLLSKNKFYKFIIVMLLSLSVFIQLSYNTSLSVGTIMSTLGTSPSEAYSFIAFNLYALLFCIVIFLASFFAPLIKVNRRLDLLILLVGVSYLYMPVVIDFFDDRDALQRQVYVNSGVARGYPSWYAAMEYYMVDRAVWRMPTISTFRAMTDTYFLLEMQLDTNSKWDDVSALNSGSQLLVLGIGESLRAGNMGIYHYARNTTPFLSNNEGSLDIYPTVYAAGTNTYGSVPASLTVSDPIPNLSLSIINLAKDAGYKTYWLSNQAKYSSWDFSVSTIAEQTDYSEFPSNDEPGLETDEVLVDKLRLLLKDTKNEHKRLVILHFYGSHMTFSDRYPTSFAKFTGEDTLVNEYDNSVLYSDFVNQEVTKVLAKQNGQYLFFADHGLGDPKGAMPFRHDLRDEIALSSLKVPLFATKPNQLNLGKEKVISLFYFECIFAQWAGIEAKQLNENKYCEKALNQEMITYIDSNLNVKIRDSNEL